MSRAKLQKYYRYIPRPYSPQSPSLITFLKVRDTPKGFVVVSEQSFDCWSRWRNEKRERNLVGRLEKFVLSAQERPFCYETPEEAFEGFIERQIFREKLLKEQLGAIGDFLNTVSPQALREIRSLYTELEANNEN